MGVMQEAKANKVCVIDHGARLQCLLGPTQGKLKLSKLFHSNNDLILRPRNSVWEREANLCTPSPLEGILRCRDRRAQSPLAISPFDTFSLLLWSVTHICIIWIWCKQVTCFEHKLNIVGDWELVCSSKTHG